MRFKAKFLQKQAWEDERFSYFGMQFAVDKAEQILAAHPREAQVAPRQFLESFVGTPDEDEGTVNEDGSKTYHINMLTVGTNKDHVDKADISRPGIVAQVIFKEDKKRNKPQKGYSILIDGNHRAKKSLKEGVEFKVYVLTPEETWQVMAPYTYAGMLKNYVNPTKKPAKPKKPVQGARRRVSPAAPAKLPVLTPSGVICKDCGEEYNEGHCEGCGDPISTHCDASNSAVQCQDCGGWFGNCCCMNKDPRGNRCNKCYDHFYGEDEKRQREADASWTGTHPGKGEEADDNF